MKIQSLLPFLLSLLSCSAICAADTTTPAPDQRLLKLEQRVDKIDNSLDQVLKLLQARQSPSATAISTASAAAAAPATPTVTAQEILTPGAMLDVWQLPEGYQGGVPSSPSLVTMVDASGSYFNMGRFHDESDMASLIGKPVLQVWNCYIKVRKSGTHVLVAEFRKGPKHWSGGNFKWHVKMDFNKETLLDETVSLNGSTDKPQSASRPVTIELQPGLYSLQVTGWLPDYYHYTDPKALTLALRIREPGAPKLREVGAEDIFHFE